MGEQRDYLLEVVAPVFPVTDIERARRFYTEVLLFEVAFEWVEHEGEAPAYLIVRSGGTELHLSLAQAPHKTVAYVFVDNVAAYYDAIQAAGGEVAEPLADQPWEMREFEVADPDGNALIFGEHLSRSGVGRQSDGAP
jgi:catechol 2,3-dioxygenase-like lactoylglutathione lyase family enzyme